MTIVLEDISEDRIYNQIVNMACDFVEEQLSFIKEPRKIIRTQNDYLKSLKKIRYDRSGCSKIFYIIIDDKIIGFEVAMIRYSKSKNYVYGEKPGIYIKPEYRGYKIDKKFIASILDQEVEKWFKQKNVTVQRINTLVNNTRQINVYKRMGYKEIKRRKGSVYFEKRISVDI